MNYLIDTLTAALVGSPAAEALWKELQRELSRMSAAEREGLQKRMDKIEADIMS